MLDKFHTKTQEFLYVTSNRYLPLISLSWKSQNNCYCYLKKTKFLFQIIKHKNLKTVYILKKKLKIEMVYVFYQKTNIWEWTTTNQNKQQNQNSQPNRNFIHKSS